MTADNLTGLVKHFNIEGTIQSITPFGSGHIHDTYRVENADPAFPDYLLQKINHQVFRRVPQLMANIETVTRHIRQKLETNTHWQVLKLVPLKTGKMYLEEEGKFWRMFLFIKDTRSYDQVRTTAQAYQGGKAFGKFQFLLADLPANALYETIPDFHNVHFRLDQFRQALEDDTAGRVKEVSEEIAFIQQRANEMAWLLTMGQAGRIPVRITHNDTKFNNVLLNAQDKAVCVIDLDTVMPGFAAYDFGDSIRTLANTAAEDEKDLSKIDLNLHLFEAYAKGFLEETHFFLIKEEIHSLAFGCKLLTYLMGLRFLTDYINGDKYYKIHFPGHNLQRARAQCRLLYQMETHYVEMQRIIHNLAS